MKKWFIFFALSVFLLSLSSATNLQITEKSVDNIMIIGLDQPAKVTLEITNMGESDSFQFYNLLGFDMAPKGTVSIANKEKKQVELLIYPKDNFEFFGHYTLEYFIRGQDNSEQEQKVTFEMSKIESAIQLSSEEITPDSTSMKIYISNIKNFQFKNVKAKVSSGFFEFEKEFDLSPYEKKEFEISINKETSKKLSAGFYTMSAEIKIDDKTAKIEGKIKFSEKSIITSESKQYGWVIITKTISKENKGNVALKSETEIKKNIISRLFTTFSPEPDVVKRNWLSVRYSWDRNLKPGEVLSIKVKTNWLFPFLIVFFIAVIIVFTKRILTTDVILRKKVSFVNAKGGQFALKVSIFVDSNSYVENVSIVDRLPALVSLYDKFSSDIPMKYDEQTRRIQWKFQKLEAGEIRVLSYIIYSKVGVTGRFGLPRASVVYEKGRKIKEGFSNVAYFISEPKKARDIY